MSDHTTVPASEHVEQDEFDQASQAGWKWFTKFLLINVIVCALALLFVGALTVWS
jgi:cytochrome c-type biogenesis protein CcmH/NrfG